ncbi:MAG: tetratricopeptide repeat protein [Polyangiales bacterium]
MLRVALHMLWIGALLPALVVRAQSVPPPESAGSDLATYSEAIREGVLEYESGNFAEAREQFRRAHAIAPNARTLRGLGLTSFELRRYREAADYLTQALASPAKPLDIKQRADTESMLERARRYLGRIRVSVEPSDAKVTVDGALARFDADGLLELEVGDHTFEFYAAGYWTTKQLVQVKGSETEYLTVVMNPESTPRPISLAVPPEAADDPREAAPLQVAPAAATTTASEPTDTPLYAKWWFWAATGAVVVAAGVTTAVLLSRDPGQRVEPQITGNTPPGASYQTLVRGQY